jgi:putative transposase
MARPLRIEFPHAIYHVTSRGDRREPIYRSDDDRREHLAVTAQAMDRFDAQLLAYCLMGNHFHLVLHTRQANLSRLMRHVNGVYTQTFNRRHGLSGHLFQGRFKAILIDRDAYLMALCRYVERNPVAAGLVTAPANWPWSSCRAHAGLEPTPEWLDTDGMHAYLLGKTPATPRDRQRAIRLYCGLVDGGDPQDANFWQLALRQQVYLGDEDFVQRMQQLATPERLATSEIPKRQRKLKQSWTSHLVDAGGNRDAALLTAYRDGGMTMTALAKEVGLSVAHVGRLIGKEQVKYKT